MFQYNRTIRSFYSNKPSYILTIWMCIIGFAKVPFLIYVTSQNLINNYNVIFQYSDDMFMDSTVQLLIGISASILFLMIFSYKVSRRLVIFLAEGSFIASLVIYMQKYNYQCYALGFTLPISTIIYPLYLDEISYDREYFNLTNYLQLSYVISQFYLSSSFENKTFIIIGICLAGFNIVISLSSSIKETTLYWYMNHESQNGKDIIDLMHTQGQNSIQLKFQEYRNRKNNYFTSQILQRMQVKKDLKVLLLSFLIPQTQVFNYFKIFNPDIYNESYYKISIILVASVVALLLLQFISHQFLQKIGFMVSIYLNVIVIIEYQINETQDDTTLQYALFFILNFFVVSVWLIQSFQQIRIRLIWLQQLVFWFSIYLSCYSQANNGYIQSSSYQLQIGQLILSCFIGFLIVCDD